MKEFLAQLEHTETPHVLGFVENQRACLHALVDSLQTAFPDSKIGLMRNSGATSGIASSLTEQFPLAGGRIPLRHLEAIWKSHRGDCIAVEPRRLTEEALETILTHSYHNLRASGFLLLPLTSASETRRVASAGIALGFSINYLRIRRQSTVDGLSSSWSIQFEEPIETLQESYAANDDELLFLVASRTDLSLPVPQHRSKKAFIFNCYFDTGGGGERATLDFAAALDDLGYRVEIVSTRRFNTSLSALKSAFGVEERFDWAVRYFDSEKALLAAVKREDVEVFVNHTYSSYLENVAPIGIYVAMFPTPTLPSNIQALLTYNTICCISTFTEEYVKRFWYDKLPCEVVYPPISSAHNSGDRGRFEDKERLILQIGRFNVEGHSKCQLEAIQTFRRLREQNILGRNWKMKVVGRINSGSKNERYIEDCREAIGTADVEIITNASLAEIRSLYRRAFCLWQFTGFGLEFGVAPQFCEHLGLVAMDCFSYGAIPMIYQRSGMVPLIHHGENGFCFGSEEELMEIMQHAATRFGSNIHKYWFDNSRASARLLNFKQYRESIQNMLWRIKRDMSAPRRMEISNVQRTA